MVSQKLRSDCPINYGLEVFGDKWSLLIIRDIIFYGKKTYGEFLRSDEKIATNILANRLLSLEQEGFIAKAPHPDDKRKDTYTVTQKALDLLPMLLELAKWSASYSKEVDAPADIMAQLDADRESLIKIIKEGVDGKRPPVHLSSD